VLAALTGVLPSYNMASNLAITSKNRLE